MTPTDAALGRGQAVGCLACLVILAAGTGCAVAGFMSGVEQAQLVLVVDRTKETKTGKPRPALFVVPIGAPGFIYTAIEIELVSPERQFGVFNRRRATARRCAGGPGGCHDRTAIRGPEPRTHHGRGQCRRHPPVRDRQSRRRRQEPQGVVDAYRCASRALASVGAEPIEIELAKLMLQKAVTLYDSGDDTGAAEAANMATYAAREASARAVEQAVQSLGGNGLTKEYSIAAALTASRLSRIAPVSRETVLNFAAQTSLGPPRSS